MKSHSYYEKRQSEGIYFTNQNYNFDAFYNKVGEALSELQKETNLFKCHKIIYTFFSTYSYSIVDPLQRRKIQNELIELSQELYDDKELQKLINYDVNNIDIAIPYSKLFYTYYTKLMSIMASIFEGMDRTYFPGLDRDKSMFGYKNYNSFFTMYIDVKNTMHELLGSYSVDSLKTTLNGMIVFYYAFRQYITNSKRDSIEKQLHYLAECMQSKDLLTLLYKEYKTSDDLKELSLIRKRVYNILLNINAIINDEHSIYKLNPQVQKKVHIDSTGI